MDILLQVYVSFDTNIVFKYVKGYIVFYNRLGNGLFFATLWLYSVDIHIHDKYESFLHSAHLIPHSNDTIMHTFYYVLFVI